MKEAEEQEETIREVSTYEQYESMYHLNLVKMNPSFRMLYSEIESLGAEEKNILIDNLARDHKQKTIELYRERELKKEQKQHLEENQYIHKK